ncbi:MAG: sulfite exporter TauE/SafE family protein [Clostridiaceae bacterium]|nr:sulfite exporter TauE/SafE family protein [Clostridiaceae bacterium]
MDLIFVVIIAIAGSFTQSLSGFGFAIIAMALWPLVIPFHTAVLVELITAFVMVLYISIKLFKYINFRLLIYPLITTVITSTLGVATLMASTETLMRRVLGGVLAILAVYFYKYSDKVKLKPTIMNGLIAGGLSGFLAGLLSIGGPPIVAYFLSVTDDKMEYNATLQFYFVLSCSYIFIVHLIMGNVTLEVMQYSFLGLIGVAVGTTAGLRLFKKLSLKTIKKIVYVFMMIAGLYMLIKG